MNITVHGTPGPQGSKVALRNPRTGRVSLVESSAKVAPWRQAVGYATLTALRHTDGFPTGPVNVTVTFYLKRPTGHYGTGRNTGTIRPGAPTKPAVKPDLDKLIRSTLDGLGQAGVWHDDAQVTTITATKQYADTRPPGAEITITTT